MPSNTAEYPAQPFERIGFAVSGGGFRAAAYGLGVLSLMHEINVDNDPNNTLLKKIRFVSSASGGTFPLIYYMAMSARGNGFEDIFRSFNEKLAGEAIVNSALTELTNDASWQGETKNRNIINAFAKSYHNELFKSLATSEKSLGALMDAPSHIEEFCFNASEFYTGLSFRFQCTTGNIGKTGGWFGNNIIRLTNSTTDSYAQIKKLRLADVLAASSCFPMGFEPIIFPEDFAGGNAPTVEELKSSVDLKTYSPAYDTSIPVDQRVKRSEKEHRLAAEKRFALMDGGICDNQGLDSMLLANSRKPITGTQRPGSSNSFDLMMVSDVTSFYMDGYEEQKPKLPPALGNETVESVFDSIKKYAVRIKSTLSQVRIWGFVIAALLILPIFFEGPHVSTVLLVIIAVALVVAAIAAGNIKKSLCKKVPVIDTVTKETTLLSLYDALRPGDSFTNRTVHRLIIHLQKIKVTDFVSLISSRALSAATMIGEVFLKHIRRLIYSKLFDNECYHYRRMFNPIYRLSLSNDLNRRQPEFDLPEDEDKQSYEIRRNAFYKDVDDCCKLTSEMQIVAEKAYTTGTTLWFEPEQETKENCARRDIIATGQFTTCFSLLRYTLSLRHSRNFSMLDDANKQRVENVLRQLKETMAAFAMNPYFLYDRYYDGLTNKSN